MMNSRRYRLHVGGLFTLAPLMLCSMRPAVSKRPADPGAAEVRVSPAQAGAGRVLFFDDFDGPVLDTSKWVAGLHVWGRNNRGVVPENVSLRTVEDDGRLVTVLDTEAHGDRYRGPVRGLRPIRAPFPMGDPRRYERVADGTRVGALVWTRERWGGGRYEVRMKNLPLSGGCSCIWNYHQAPGEYTEIDIEMPANGTADGSDWARWAGLNTYYPDENQINEMKLDLGGPQNDGRFHVYRWDWWDGTNGEPRVDFYLDGRLLHSARTRVPRLPAQLWVGNWPAPWSGNFAYDTQHLYVDWVRITELHASDSRPRK